MVFFLIALFIFIDRVTKILAFNNLRDGKVIDIIKNYFDLSYLENRGAAFGIFQGKPIILGIVSILFLVYIIYLYKTTKTKSKIFKISLALIISGALGNLYDRFIHGYVIDFLHFHYKEAYHFPTFNVADICVVVGTFLLLVFMLFIDDKKDSKKETY